ncbi:MAG: hypothetical protein R8L07_09820 [Alphaproteobacteria bacterium]|nr:hypothetical protein [Alphaproteobacteria bacterium]
MSKPRLETRVAVLESCPVYTNTRKAGVELSPLLLSLVTTFGPIILEKSYDAAVSAVRKAGEGGKAEQIGSSHVATYAYALTPTRVETVANVLEPKPPELNINGSFHCLVIAKGNVNPDTPSAPSRGTMTEAQLGTLSKKLGIVGDPVFYLEAVIQESEEGKEQFYLQPKHFEFFDDDGWFSRDQAVTFQIDLMRLQEDGTTKVIASDLLLFSKVSKGTVMSIQTLKGTTSAWMPMPPAPTDFADGRKASYRLLQSQIDTLTKRLRQLDKMKTTCEVNPDLAGDGEACYAAEGAARLAAVAAAVNSDSRVIAQQDKVDILNDAPKGKTNRLATAEARLKRLRQVVRSELIAQLPQRYAGIDQETSAIKRRVQELETEQMKLVPSETELVPITVKATVSTVKDEVKFLTTLAEVLDEGKDDVLKAVGDELPAAKEAAKETKLAEQATLMTKVTEEDFTVKIEAARLAQLEPTKETDPVPYYEQEKKLALAKISANEARRKAGLPQIH